MLYIKALHIIFVITWFAGIFYMPRLFIYNTEAQDNPSPEAKRVLTEQFEIMMKRLWRGITIPSAILTAIFGPLVMYRIGYFGEVNVPSWLWAKLAFVLGLYVYFFFLHAIFKQQMKRVYKYSSMQLRIWNEVATIFLVIIVFLVSVKDAMSWIYGLIGLVIFIIVLMSAIKVYKIIRQKKS